MSVREIASLPELVAHRPALPAPAAGFDRELAQSLAPGARRPTEIAPVRTPLTGPQAASALSTAWRRLHGGQPPGEKLLHVLVAQWAHETGRGEAMVDYNFGGLKGVGPSGLSTTVGTREGEGASERRVVARFRAYPTAAEGAEDYLRLLGARFPGALDAAARGDAPGFVHALKAGGYFTGSEDDYARSVTSLASHARSAGFDALTRPSGPGPSGALSPPRLDLSSARGLPLAIGPGSTLPTTTIIDSIRLADQLAEAAMRIATSQPEDHGNEIERLDPRSAT